MRPVAQQVLARAPKGSGEPVSSAICFWQYRGGCSECAEESGLSPNRLELEITETLLLSNTDATMAILKKLKAIGVSIVMDDFGTGYSSLSYLWKFPFDKIKIDRSFMAALEESDDGVETVLKSIIDLGREMKMRVTVEGVETERQVDFLYNAHADQVQGFYFGEPLQASELGADVLGVFPHLTRCRQQIKS